MTNQVDKNRMCIGIDLGTTNTTVCISRVDTHGFILLEDCEIRQRSEQNERNQDRLPSIMYVKNNGKEVVGHEARELKKASISTDNEVRYIENSKRFIGTTRTWQIDGTTYSPIDVAAKILMHARKFSRIRDLLEDSDVYITVPANFDTDQINNTLEAAKKAGFANVKLRAEPKAAILSFLHEEMGKREHKKLDISSKKRILVVDIGGGTCDICVEDVWEKPTGGCAFEHKAVGRDNIGGIDFDVRIADYLAAKYCSFELTKSDRAILIETAQTIKETLSSRISYLIEDEYDGDFESVYTASDWQERIEDTDEVMISQTLSGGKINFRMSVEEFCMAVIPLVKNTAHSATTNKDERDAQKNMEDLLRNTLEENDIDADSVDLIFLTGGMSKCFVLKAALYEILNKPIIVPSDPMLAVSRGAALMNKYDQEDIVSHDIMPRSILIETNSGHLKKLVSMGERVPVTKTVDEVFTTTSRTGVIIRLFEGKDEFDNQLRKLNSVYKLTYDPQEVGREFRIEYTIDKTKRIKFTLHYEDNGATHEIAAQVKSTEE